MRQKIFFLKRFNSELLYRFFLTLSMSTNNSKYLDIFRIGPSQIARIQSTSFSITVFWKPKDSFVWIWKI
ncbi:hypothetical protein PAHAL_1G167300 [Panicum hallii]|uniref:Uncharacterized protein n=1 Tax=Panicum hallii TaxID=206008 RepID=A0A2T8KVF7_9POAL|nr:hypothetical protein PAHAL_1G167300 [Panicum hallii]